ncbi:MAG: tRNA (adenosine(37)-N6)-threonylcarbamoyltransferase complex transferase subunit TsaD [Acidobacteria bacterium]|nr:tRNA (adenosine(37)-N6)-threonylcarbamoyltransferase complex transferase subunit TsaD [Acidobacteriota bacterium]
MDNIEKALNPAPVRILGIETSCDETAAAVVESGARIASSVVASQMATHGKYGGVVPELACREHLRAIVPVVREAVEQAGLQYPQLDAIAVTQGPGLVGALLVGLTYAKSLALSLDKPLVAVNHLEGHIYAVLLEEHLQQREEPEFPALSLVVSGGHTLIAVTKAVTKKVTQKVTRKATQQEISSPATEARLLAPLFSHRIVGRTRDDAAGEAFDKVAKLLGLGYPGGPVLDQLARHGNPDAVAFTKAKMKGNSLDFSFSGIKTAVLRYVQTHGLGTESAERAAFRKQHPEAGITELLSHTSSKTLDLLASFQKTVVEELLQHCLAAVETEDVNSVFIVGGVAANSLLRERFRGLAGRLPPVFFPRPSLTTDNAAMIAAAAFPKFQAGRFASWETQADARLALDQ